MPLLYKKEQPFIGVWKMEESVGEMLSLMGDKDLYKKELEQIGSDSRRKEWLATRLLLKELLGREVMILYRDSGAPYLPTEHYSISISHTRGYVAIILSKTKPSGIDIEYYSERVRKIRIRYLSPEEEAFIDLSHETEHLLVCWCAKETLYKIIDQPEVDFRSHLHILPFHYSAQGGSFQVYETKTEQHNCYTLYYSVTAEYVLVWR